MLKKVKNHVMSLLESALREAVESGGIKIEKIPGISLEIPRAENHGDVSSNLCFLAGKENRLNPVKVAQALLETKSLRFEDDPYVEKIEVAGPGFLNIFLKFSAHQQVLPEIHSEGWSYGSSALGSGESVMIEFVSANPTGPLHIGHARNAVVGDVMARILKFSGYEVKREYYLNDSGKQINSLGASLKQRYLEASGAKPEGEPEYKGSYLKDMGEELLEKDGGMVREHPESFFSELAVKKITEGIRDDLESFSVSFDSWFNESLLHESGMIEKMAGLLKQKKAALEREGALWFLSSSFGDEKDRVIIRSNGAPTYLAADIAYHYKKLESGCSRLINVWGADHHGYIPRISGVIQAMGYPPETLSVILIQLVKLSRAGKPVPMSTRSGEFVTLREVLDEVGNDSLRFFMLMRRSDAQLDFDIELAKKHSVENPVYYVQYAHARICSLIKKARENGIDTTVVGEGDFAGLTEPQEIVLLKALGLFPEVVKGSARTLEPHRLTGYLQDTASKFHNFYDKSRVVGENDKTAGARLYLAEAAGIVLRNGLGLLGVSSPEEM